MMGIELTPAIARELNITLISLWEEGAAEQVNQDMGPGVETDITDLFYAAPSESTTNVYTFVQKSFSMRKVPAGTNERIVDAIDLYEARLTNEDVYKTIGVGLNDWNDDKIGKYAAVFYQLGKASALALPRMCEAVISVAKTQVHDLDGVPLLSTSHPRKPGTAGNNWSNLLTQSGGLTFDNFAAAWRTMVTFPDEDGKSAGALPTHLVVTPRNIAAAFDIVTNEYPSALQGGRNPWYGRGLKIKCIANLDSLDEWGLVDNRWSKEKAFVSQIREPIQLRSITDLSSPYVLLGRQLIFSNDGRQAAGFGHPCRIVWSKKS